MIDHRVWLVTTEDVTTAAAAHSDGFAARMAYAVHKDPGEGARRTTLHLRLTAVTLGWLVSVPLLLGYGLLDDHHGGVVATTTALLAVTLPFVAAAMATHAGRFGIAGVYVVITLLMALPAAVIAQLG